MYVSVTPTYTITETVTRLVWTLTTPTYTILLVLAQVLNDVDDSTSVLGRSAPNVVVSRGPTSGRTRLLHGRFNLLLVDERVYSFLDARSLVGIVACFEC